LVMSRTCLYAFAGRFGPAEWSFDEVSLIVSPVEGRPLVFPVRELAGIAGDGFSLELTVPGPAAPAAPADVPSMAGETAPGAPGEARPGGEPPAPAFPRLMLAKLGAEGPTLLDALQRSWSMARARALRLGGSGEGKPFSGMVAGFDSSGNAEPFKAQLFEDVMVVAREGRDLEPLFVALVEKMGFDEDAYAIQLREWPERELVFSRLAKQTHDLLDTLSKHRQALADEAGTLLASAVPGLPGAYRGILAGEWPPGRLRTLEEMEDVCPGFGHALRDTWLAACLRRDEGAFLLDWAGPASTWLGCSRETSDTGDGLLWLFAGKGGKWFLESLAGEDRATYHFVGGEELPALVSRLLCAPQFSKEALYGTPDMLTGERADLAIPAQLLGFLVSLRSHFKSRVIHASPEGWRKDVEAIAGS
jgi:hypothetical protein